MQASGLRDLVTDSEREVVPHEFSYNLVREAHMRREVQRVVREGVKPERIVVVAGAYHLTGLGDDLPPMSDEELAALPRIPTRITLMPYSYYRLSSRTGYGAGNRAPFYFERLWQLMGRALGAAMGTGGRNRAGGSRPEGRKHRTCSGVHPACRRRSIT